MEVIASAAQKSLRLAHEIARRAPERCPSKLAAVGASVLLVVATAVAARLAVHQPEDLLRVHESDVCRQCRIRDHCKHRADR